MSTASSVVEYGEILLGTGNHDVTVELHYETHGVFLSMAPGDQQVCGGSDGDDVAVELIDGNTFVIHALVKSDWLSLRWVSLLRAVWPDESIQ